MRKKRMKKQTWCILALLMAVLACGKVQTVQAADLLDGLLVKAPDSKVEGLAITASTMDSVTLTWKKAVDAETYYISYWESAKPSTSKDIDDIGNVSEYKITNLGQAKYVFQIQPANKLHIGTPLKGQIASVEGAPAPTAPTAVQVNNVKKGYGSFYIQGLAPVYHSEIQILDAAGTPIAYEEGSATGAAVEDPAIANNGFYAACVRGYYEQAGGYRSYGDWSEPCYFSTDIKPLTVIQKNRKLQIKWPKVQGAKNYRVYLSTRASGGFTQAAKTTGLTANVAKYGGAKLRAGKTYYVKVTASMGKDGETYTAESKVKKVKIK